MNAFQECPMYFIQMWNTIKGHANRLQFDEADNDIIATNKIVRHIFFHENNTKCTARSLKISIKTLKIKKATQDIIITTEN